MSKLSRYTSSEQELLKFSLIWVFSTVSKADGAIDDKEIDQFKNDLRSFSSKLINDPEISDYRLDADIVFDIFQSVSDEFDLLNQNISKSPLTAMEGLKKVTLLTDNQFSKGESDLFKKMLITVAINVADSSGGWHFLKNNISKLEASAINDIKAALKVN